MFVNDHLGNSLLAGSRSVFVAYYRFTGVVAATTPGAPSLRRYFTDYNVHVLRVVRIGAILEWNGNKWESSLGPPILECNPCPSAILESPARSVRIWVQVRIHFL